MSDKKAFIISGGAVDLDFAARFLSENRRDSDMLIAADQGLFACEKLGMKPQALVGDFDTAGRKCLEPYRNDPDVEMRLFRAEKDWTDTEMAAELAMEKGCIEIVLLGGTGTRIDHVLGNIQVLALAMSRGVPMIMVDPHNRIHMHNHPFTMKKSEQYGHFVSLFACGGDVQGLTLRGFRYEVENFTLGSIGSRAVSNEIAEEEACVEFRSGRLLVIESRD